MTDSFWFAPIILNWYGAIEVMAYNPFIGGGLYDWVENCDRQELRSPFFQAVS
ncbi:hypothetical protein PHOSAC3_120586 [Mesotoga infera]|nr:hypothetical protein PHOSAC3_120586 [Mesotoga infera]